MKIPIFTIAIVFASFAQAKSSMPECSSKKEQIRLPGMNLCVTDFANPDSACICSRTSKQVGKTLGPQTKKMKFAALEK